MKIRPADVRAYVDRRLNEILEWYTGCDLVAETLANVRVDIASLMKEVSVKYSIKDLPFILEAKFDDGYIVVRAVNRKVS